MTNGNGTMQPPSSIAGDSYPYPSNGVPIQIAIPGLLSPPSYTDLPFYWSWRRDVTLAATIHKEDMWSAAVARTATKFAAHSYTVKDSNDSQRKVAASQALMKQANGGEGWIQFAMPCVQDLLTTDNGVFIRVRRADDEVETIKLKAQVQSPYQADQTFQEAQVVNSSRGAKITGLYHLDSLRCMRTGNLTYPVRYWPVMGAPQLLRWDQVLIYSDQKSARAELYGVGYCAASRAYKTIAMMAALRQMLYEFVAGKGANKVSFVGGLSDTTLKSVIKGGELDAQAKGLVYYLGTILGAIPSDVALSLTEVILKQMPQGFDFKQVIDDVYLVYANSIGIPVQDIQPLSGQGLGTGTQSVVLQEQAQGIGIAAFIKWWEQTFSDRVFPATTELTFDNDNDLRDQQARAQARQLRGADRAARITSGEISPPIARQLAADDGDLPQELLARDVTPGGQISDDEKPQAQQTTNPAALALIGTEPTAAPQAAMASVGKSFDDEHLAIEQATVEIAALLRLKPEYALHSDDDLRSHAASMIGAVRRREKSYDALFAAELAIARSLARWAE